MISVTVSKKFQVVIPKGIRDIFVISPGDKFQVVPFESRIELIPVKKIKKTRGFLKRMDTKIEREKDRV